MDIVATRLRERVIDRQAVARHTARYCTLHLYTDETKLRYPHGTYADLVQCGDVLEHLAAVLAPSPLLTWRPEPRWTRTTPSPPLTGRAPIVRLP